jgi:nitroimidazol reductase NimA-like FMN-containing flavoprotein (pyridoxamine 5'-phosphate oxidase superfamily)
MRAVHISGKEKTKEPGSRRAWGSQVWMANRVLNGKAKVVPERLTFEYESAIVFGIAVEVKEDDEKRKGLRLLASKYSPGYEQAAEDSIARKLRATTIIRIQIEQVTGKGRGSGK